MAIAFPPRTGRRDAETAVAAMLLAGCLVVPLMFTIAIDDVFALPKAAAVRLLVSLGVGTLCAGALLNRRRTIPSLTRIDWVLGAFVLLNVLAVVWSADPMQSLNGERFQFQGLATVLSYVGGFYLARTTIRTDERLSLLFWSIALGATVVAAYGLIQAAGLDPIWGGGPPGRVFSSIGQPNALAAYLVVTIPVAGALTLRGGKASRWLAAVSVAMMVVALTFTYSRAGYAALAVAVLIFAALVAVHIRPTKRQLSMLALAVALVAVCVMAMQPARTAAENIWQRAVSGTDARDESSQLHYDLWKAGAAIAFDHPVLGTGQETFPEVFPAYRDKVLSPERARVVGQYRPESPHNVYLAIATGAGVPAMLLYLAFACLVAMKLYRSRLQVADRWRTVAVGAILAATAGHLVTDFFMTAEVTSSWLWWCLLGAGVAAASPTGIDRTIDHAKSA